jgi:NAD(P)-dependent dehydrogenase (short-subunit alcohol dehydrogenase family)
VCPACTARRKKGIVIMASIADRTVLVTGGNRGIGRALVEEALNRGAALVYAGTCSSASLRRSWKQSPSRHEHRDGRDDPSPRNTMSIQRASSWVLAAATATPPVPRRSPATPPVPHRSPAPSPRPTRTAATAAVLAATLGLELLDAEKELTRTGLAADELGT